ncbi:hypothetical protein ABK040_015156 [Willaertia magna]
MRKRDFAIFAFVCFLLILTLNQEGSITLDKAFYLTREAFHQQPLMVKSGQGQLLPKPIITDIDGDGYKDLITCSEDGKISLSSLKTISSSLLVHQDMFNPISEEKSFNVNERTDVNNNDIVHHSILGLGTGHLKVKKKKSQRNTKRIITLLSNWKVLCLDPNLQLEWEIDLLPNILELEKLKPEYNPVTILDLVREEIKPTDVSIALYPWRVHEQDEGLIIIGMKHLPELFNYLNIPPYHQDATTSTLAYYCLDGKTGELRWKHDISTIQSMNIDKEEVKKKNVHDDNEFYDQHSFKLRSNQHLTESGEVSWREYKKKIQHHLPHLFRHQFDSFIRLDNFQPTKKDKFLKIKEKKENLEFGEFGDKVKSFITNQLSKTTDVNSKLKKNIELMKRFEKVPNVFVSHTNRGIEVLHLYTGRLLTKFSPLRENVIYTDVNFDKMIDSVEAINCKARIESGGSPTTGFYDTLFSKSVCRLQPSSFLEQFSIPFLMTNEYNDVNQNGNDEDLTEVLANEMDVVAPTYLEHFTLENKPYNRGNDLLFLTSTGLVTCITFDRKLSKNGIPRFRIKWQSLTQSNFRRERLLIEIGEESESFFPEIISYSLRKFETHSFSLAVGEKRITVLDLFGNIQQVIELPSSSISPIQMVDINNDGILDIIVTTKYGVYGYAVRVHTGMSVLSFLVISLFIVVGLLYLSTYIQLNDPFYHRKSEKYNK